MGDPKHRCAPGRSWSLFDARGIYCGRVCDKCEAEQRARFRPEIFTDPNYSHSEPIEEE